ncbi:MAG TPA: hypothetical protein VLK85_04475 [Ramlibacter sp.]|nr:hypothetical protein [Ramlibacter sp.]
MNPDSRLDDLNHVHDAARARAAELRHEAQAWIWHASGEAARRAQRSANRLAHRLARHTRLREQQGA